MLNVGGAELLIILLVALVFLGPQRLPDVARQLGQAVSSMRSLASGFQAEMEAASKPVKDAMKLDGPTDQAQAIAQTQSDPFAGKSSAAPRAESTRTDIDPESLKELARKVEYDDAADDTKSSGGPTDLRDDAADDTKSSGGPTDLRDGTAHDIESSGEPSGLRDEDE